MTQEHHGPDPDDIPPPVSTRWSRAEGEVEEELPPPFVPGRSADAAATSTGAEAEAAALAEAEAPQPPPGEAPMAASTEPPEPAGAPTAAAPTAGPDEEPFPFEFPWEDEEAAEESAEEEVALESLEAPLAGAPAGEAETEPVEEEAFPFDQLDGALEEPGAAEADRGDLLPGEGGPQPEEAPAAETLPDEGWEPYGDQTGYGFEAEVEAGIEPGAEAEAGFASGTEAGSAFELEAEPEGAFDTDAEAEADIEPEPEPEPEPETPVAPRAERPFGAGIGAEALSEPEEEPWAAAPEGDEVEAAGPDAGRNEVIDEVAALLERTARRLREDGLEAVEADMESGDRLMSLLSGLVAGYISGRG